MNEDAIDRKLVCAFITGLISDDEERKKGLEYIRNIPSVNPQPCEDAISRAEAVRVASGYCHPANVAKDLAKLPPVNLQPKTGHWEQYGNSWEDKFKCSECGKEQPKILCGKRIIGHWSDYCPNCGCRMVEPQESEDKRMELIINIPDHLYNVIKNKECTNKNVLTKAVENGTPLDKIRAEIEAAMYIDRDTKLCKNANASGLEVALQIINKYKAEEGGEEV